MSYKILVLVALLGYSILAGPTEYRSPFTYDGSDPRIKHYHIESEKTGISYPVHVFLPQGYVHQDKIYPVIYSTDGQWLADLFGLIKEKEIILVAIEQGPNNRRKIDYVKNVEAYFSFFTDELLPFIEDKYRIDSEQRAVVGTSLGGLFVGYALLVDKIDNPYFKVYGAFDGTFGIAKQPLQDINKIRRCLSEKMNTTVFLTGTKQGNEKHVQNFQKTLETADYTGLRIIKTTHKVSHEDITYPSFEEMVKVLY